MREQLSILNMCVTVRLPSLSEIHKVSISSPESDIVRQRELFEAANIGGEKVYMSIHCCIQANPSAKRKKSSSASQAQTYQVL